MNVNNTDLHQLTHPDKEIAIKVAENINKDYPLEASVIDDCCYITKQYYDHCKDLVKARCKIKPLDNNEWYRRNKTKGKNSWTL